MKKLIFLFLCISFQLNAQIKFSQNNNAQLSSGSVLIEFDDDINNSKGLILPTVNTLDARTVDGTILFDGQSFQFKVKQNGEWVAMNELKPNVRLNVSEINLYRDKEEGGIIIGDENEVAVRGALVLASKDKAMVLPKIKTPDVKVVDPYVGMICYDTESNMLAMFDGVEWNYWE